MMKFLRDWMHHLKASEVLQIARWKTIRDREGKAVMSQLTLVCLLGWHLRVHIFWSGDGDDYHSHPRAFVSVGLLGGYTERLSTGEIRFVSPGKLTVRKPSDVHNVQPQGRCVTLALTSPVIASWSKGPLDSWTKK